MRNDSAPYSAGGCDPMLYLGRTDKEGHGSLMYVTGVEHFAVIFDYIVLAPAVGFAGTSGGLLPLDSFQLP
eukprot:gene37992-15444_t